MVRNRALIQNSVARLLLFSIIIRFQYARYSHCATNNSDTNHYFRLRKLGLIIPQESRCRIFTEDKNRWGPCRRGISYWYRHQSTQELRIKSGRKRVKLVGTIRLLIAGRPTDARDTNIVKIHTPPINSHTCAGTAATDRRCSAFGGPGGFVFCKKSRCFECFVFRRLSELLRKGGLGRSSKLVGHNL